MTMAWKREIKPYAPHVASHNMGKIVYIHFEEGDFKNHDPSTSVFCANTTTSFDCCFHPFEDMDLPHTHTMIVIKLKCGCFIPLGFNFHHAIREMRSTAGETQVHVLVGHARFFI